MVTLTGIINDLHLPFHDQRAVDLVLDAYEDIGIDRLFINGDLLDFLNVSLHGPKHPDIQQTLEDEINSGREFLSNLRKRFKDIEIILQCGNHETRLERFIIQKCPAFWNLYKLESMLNVQELGIEYIEYNNRYRLEETNLYIQHSPPSYTSSKAAFSKKLDQSSIYGCSHRVESYATTGASGEVYQTLFNGHLVDNKKHHRVFSYAKNHENWQQCASLVAVKNKTDFHIQQSIIKNYSISFNGVLYEG